MKKFKVLGIAGSFRRDSHNRAVLKSIQALAPDDVEVELFDISGLPLFNQDIETPLPESVEQWKAKIRAADAVVIATPEYNASIPGALKNAIDWASRPYGDNAWAGKRVAPLGATPGRGGTARAQAHLRQILTVLRAEVLPELLIPEVQRHLDDPALTAQLRDILERVTAPDYAETSSTAGAPRG